MLVTLCVGDLGVLGVQPDFALGNDRGRNKLNFGYGVGGIGAIDNLSGINFIKDVCRQTRPMLAQLEKGAYFYQKTIERLVNGDIPNALHKLPVVEEIRYKRSKHVSDNLNKQETPEHLQAGGSDIHHVSNVYTNTSLFKHVRKKRGLLGLAVPIIAKLPQ